MIFVSKQVGPVDPEVQRKAMRTLLWFGMVSITMLFAGLTSAYMVRQGEGKWAEFSLPGLFTLSTVILLVSSATIHWAVMSVKKGNLKNLITGMLLTLMLGLGFVVTQYYAWTELYHNGIVFSGHLSDIKTDFKYVPSGNETLAEAAGVGNVAASFLYVLTGLHILHLIAGVIALIIVFSRTLAGKYSAANYNGVRMCAIYWHFLDGLWLYLFLFLLYIR